MGKKEKAMDDSPQEKGGLREQVQAQIVSLITSKLQSGEMSEERAREIAAMVLEKLPEDLSDQELMLVLPKLDDNFRELSDVVMPIIIDYEKKIKNTIEEKVLKLVREQRFQQALQLAKQGIDYQSKLG
ncbi:MAG: hypothetical protein ACOCXP_01075 [Candidatus Dojkabacteria bacterium]